MRKTPQSLARLLITGGGGLLGRELVRRAPACGWEVRATWWSTQPDLPVDWVHADVRDELAMVAATRDVDAVIHTAYRQGDEEWSTNVEGSRLRRARLGGRAADPLSTDLVFDGLRGRYREDDAVRPHAHRGARDAV